MNTSWAREMDGTAEAKRRKTARGEAGMNSVPAVNN
jgi:hypothetical protein